MKGRCLNRLTMEPYIQFRHLRCQAPQVGLEPTTSRLTAVRSTIELLRNKYTLKTATESTSFLFLWSSLRPISIRRHTDYSAYTTDLSTSYSLRGLISLRYGISYLGGGFTLRCLQRLSLPNLASQPCSWHCNWSTSGSSIPVLSY